MRPFPRRTLLAILAAALVPTAATAQDPPLQPGQQQLIELALDAAAAVPAYPHAKTKALLQENAVTACLELGQTALAEQLLARCDRGWRQGVGYADLAIILAERGSAEHARKLLELASQLGDSVLQDDNPQQWRRDRVRARIARAYGVLGDNTRAAEFAQGLEPREAATLARDSTDMVAKEGLDACLASVDATFTVGDFDQVNAALGICARLYGRFYDDAERRQQFAQRVRTGFPKLPMQARLELVASLVETAIEHRDRPEAAGIAADLPVLMARVDWLPELETAWLARVASLRYRAGDEAGGRRDLAAAVAEYEAQRTRIADAARADVLREVAAAWHAQGDREQALATFRTAVDEGAHNPNARPRAEDLVATCVALARCAIDPDEALWARLREVRAGLEDPW